MLVGSTPVDDSMKPKYQKVSTGTIASPCITILPSHYTNMLSVLRVLIRNPLSEQNYTKASVTSYNYVASLASNTQSSAKSNIQNYYSTGENI